jgi:phage anti-repressor protein
MYIKEDGPMNELINKPTQTPIEIALGIDENGMTTARKLYEFLELAKGQFSRWCKTNILENTFAEEGTDYIGFDINVEGNLVKDYKLTAAFAKKLSMTAKNEKGEQAREYFVRAEDKLKEIAQKPKTPMELLELEFKAIKEVEQKVEAVDQDLQSFKMDMPLLAVECDKITTAVKTKGIECLGGKNSNAYKDKPLRSRVYQDIHHQLKREFGVSSYKAIKRNQCDYAVQVVNNYRLPLALQEEINNVNSQLALKEAMQ